MPMEYMSSDAVQTVLRCITRRALIAENVTAAPVSRMSALQERVHTKRQRRENRPVERPTPMQRMQACRDSLTRLDQGGWNRSYHQRLFHEDFLVRISCPWCAHTPMHDIFNHRNMGSCIAHANCYFPVQNCPLIVGQPLEVHPQCCGPLPEIC